MTGSIFKQYCDYRGCFVIISQRFVQSITKATLPSIPIIRIEHSAYFIPFLKKLIISQCKSRWLPVALLLFKIKEGACIITSLNYVLHFTVQLSTFSKFKKRSKPLQEQNKIKL